MSWVEILTLAYLAIYSMVITLIAVAAILLIRVQAATIKEIMEQLKVYATAIERLSDTNSGFLELYRLRLKRPIENYEELEDIKDLDDKTSH